MESKKYYTYRYAYPQGFIHADGTDLSGVVFYVGKGTVKRYNQRIDDHEAEARRGCSILCGITIWNTLMVVA